MQECHLIPFYSAYVGVVAVEHCDLDATETVIRGIRCTRRVVQGVPIYRNNVLITKCYQWVLAGEEKTVFDRGVELCMSTLGLPQAAQHRSILHFLNKKRAR